MTMRKIINDLLKGPTGKYSRKSTLLFVSFIMASIIGIWISISDYILDKEINRYVIDVFNGFLLLVATLAGVTVWDKQSLHKQNKKIEEEQDA